MDQIRSSVVNNTFTPSSMDLLLAVPRLAQRAGEFAFVFLPEQIDGLWRKAQQPSVIAEPTTSQLVNTTITTDFRKFAQGTQSASAAASAAAQSASDSPRSIMALNFQVFTGIFGYLVSKWALATFATAIVLNRTTFYASSRVPLSLRWHLRLGLYILPILTFLYQTQWILQALKCQTSPSWSTMQYGNETLSRGADFAGEGGFLYRLSSSLIFWEDDIASCASLDMLPAQVDSLRPSGSLRLLWPFFCSVLLSQFVETLACALQGRQVMPENGLTIWEHSLAFAEAEATFTRPLAFAADGSVDQLTRTAILQGMNAPPEVLAITLISGLSHLTSNILAVVGLRTKLRLINTGIWGMAYMFVLVWGFFRSTVAADAGDLRILRFPSVCLIGFVPHILILISIIVCSMIYGIALIITALSLPPGPNVSNLRERFSAAYRNLQANSHLSSNSTMRLNYQEDFFTALLKIGFAVLTAASEAVFLNEGARVNVAPTTWLEERRIQEIAAQRSRLIKRALETVPVELRSEGFDEGLGSSANFISGYARERKPDSASSTSSNNYRAVERDSGVGFLRRGTKFSMSIQLLKGIWWLQVGFGAQILVTLYTWVGLAQPAWLVRFVRQREDSKRRMGRPANGNVKTLKTLDFWVLGDDGQMKLANSQNIDVEVETRRRLLRQPRNAFDQQLAEEALDDNLYNWWKQGGWWSETDTSGEFQPSYADDDTTSVISTADGSELDWSDITDDEDGRRTPTQQDPFPSRESTPFSHDLLDTGRLASLLDPKSPEEQEEALLLARHLRSDRIMTRSQHQRLIERERSRVFTSSRYGPGLDQKSGPISPEEEERALEAFLIERRTGNPSSTSDGSGTWDTGADGMGSTGPQCVVCQSTPRTILMWPCGCLSLCDDCRLGLATRNFDACVCCRRKVISYSRMYVP